MADLVHNSVFHVGQDYILHKKSPRAYLLTGKIVKLLRGLLL